MSAEVRSPAPLSQQTIANDVLEQLASASARDGIHSLTETYPEPQRRRTGPSGGISRGSAPQPTAATTSGWPTSTIWWHETNKSPSRLHPSGLGWRCYGRYHSDTRRRVAGLGMQESAASYFSPLSPFFSKTQNQIPSLLHALDHKKKAICMQFLPKQMSHRTNHDDGQSWRRKTAHHHFFGEPL